jgi:hypothetical protein
MSYTLILKSFIKLKCLFKSVASIFSKHKNRNRFHSAGSKFKRKLNDGLDLSKSQDAEA